MAENSAIEWCDHTFNPWEGCQKVGPGCDHCYAETRNARFGGGTALNWGPNAPRRLTSKSNWQKPLRWQTDAAAFLAKYGRRQRVFCASLADVFDNAVPDQWRSALFDLIHRTPDLDWLLLTKRIGNVAKLTDVEWGTEDWPQNVWLGATIVNQAEADRDIPKLLATRGPRIRFLSMEPLLGPVELHLIQRGRGEPAGVHCRTCVDGSVEPWGGGDGGRACDDCDGTAYYASGLDWVIVGGESGSGARPMHPDWARSLRDQCAAAGVPLLFKQWGEWVPLAQDNGGEWPADQGGCCRLSWEGDRVAEGWPLQRVGKKAAGRLLDSVQHDGVPT